MGDIMKVKRIVVGYYETNCYLIIKDNDSLIVDPGDEYNTIKNELGNLNLQGILVTHRHDDHIGALDKLVAEYKVVVYDKKRSEGNYSVHPFNFSIIENKGHSDDSISFYFKDENIMFTGDFLFKGTIGRTDLKTGSSKDMVISLINIKKYNPNTIIYPGHGEESTLGYEFENNMFFKNI